MNMLNSRAHTLSVKVTFYGYPDNDDGQGNYGTDIIAHALQWQGRDRHKNAQGDAVAGGTGSFDDPITAAAGVGNTLMPPGTLVYIHGLKKYFLLEDDCADCSIEEWIDLWIGATPEASPRRSSCVSLIGRATTPYRERF